MIFILFIHMMIEEIVKVGARGQIVIPSKIRRKEKIMPNTYVRVLNIEGKIVIDKVKLTPANKLIKSLAALKLTEKDWQEIQKERERER